MSAPSLTEVRARAATALAPALPTDPAVHANLVDSLEPPALMVMWGDPWLTPTTFCSWDAQLEILCLAARLEPGAGVEKLEQLVSYVIGRFDADPYSWPAATSQAPRVFEIGGVPYLGARLVFRVQVSTESEVSSYGNPQAVGAR